MPTPGSSEWGSSEWAQDGAAGVWTPVVVPSVAGWAQTASGVEAPPELSEWMSEWGTYEWGAGGVQPFWTLVQPGVSLWSQQ